MLLRRISCSGVLYNVKHCSRPSLITIRHRATTSTLSDAAHPTPVVGPETTATNFKDPDFDNPKDAFRSKTTVDLLRAYFVFKMCSVGFIVDNQAVILRTTRRLLGEKLFRYLMKQTMYGQFMAGEDSATVLKRAAHHRKYNVIPMFAYTAKEVHGVKGEGSLGYDDPLWKINFDALMDEIDMANDSVKGTSEYAKMSGKYTFLVTPDVLESATSVIHSQTKLMNECLEGVTAQPIRACVEAAMTHLPAFARKYELVIPGVPWSKSNIASYSINIASHLALHDNEKLKGLIQENTGNLPPSMSSIQREELLKLWHWMVQIGEKASGRHVSVVIDAEQTYLQLAIDNLTIDLMRLFNKHRPVIHNTYQNYLKRTFGVVERDLALADKERFCIGLKPVRGAYIDEERRLAAEKGYEDPINATYDATSEMYHRVARMILDRIQDNKTHSGTQVTFATHNIDTVRTIIGMLRDMRLFPEDNNVAFAQLLGMRDHIAFPLGAAGYPAHKLLHYGPVDQAMTYMSRRLMENRSGVATANSERQLLGQELKRRLLGRS